MISIKRAAVGALVLRPANGGAAIKLHLACALPALRVRLDIARQGPQGPSGAGGSGDLQVVAAVALSGHVVVVLDAAGQAIAADPSNALHSAAVVGITRGAVAQGELVALAGQGSFEHLGWTFTSGLPVYLGSLGALVQTVPMGASFIKVLGMAQSATRITVSLQPAIFIN